MITPLTDNDLYRITQEASEAYIVFRQVIKLPRNKNSVLKFYEFLGAKSCNEPAAAWATVRATPLAHKRIKLLNSPHARTILKAWLAQNNDN